MIEEDHSLSKTVGCEVIDRWKPDWRRYLKKRQRGRGQGVAKSKHEGFHFTLPAHKKEAMTESHHSKHQ
jgi:hypothetical protein